MLLFQHFPSDSERILQLRKAQKVKPVESNAHSISPTALAKGSSFDRLCKNDQSRGLHTPIRLLLVDLFSMLPCRGLRTPDLRHSGCGVHRLPARSAFQLSRCRRSRDAHLHARCRAADLDFDALLFDCDGVLCDTEAEGHRVGLISRSLRFKLK